VSIGSILVFGISALLFASSVSCTAQRTTLPNPNSRIVELIPIDLDPDNPERKEFDRLTLLGAFELRGRNPRFGGLSGLTIGNDEILYTVSDRGYWILARMILAADGALLDLVDWNIHPILGPKGRPVTSPFHDAEALTRAADGSFLVAFEQVHRIWRYPPPPETFHSLPAVVPIPPELAKAPRNGGIEALAAFHDGRVLAMTEAFRNPDGSFKAWLLENDRFAELSYVSSAGYRVTGSAALSNGDVIVLERRYRRFGILSARLKLIRGKDIRLGAKLSGEELLRLQPPLNIDNFEGVAVQEHPTNGTLIYIVSDDNHHALQRTLLLQFSWQPDDP
jgi:hypothetical protein